MRRIQPAVLFGALALSLLGCTSPAVVQERNSLLSDLTDCAPDEIATRNGRRHTWTATCQGVVYSCSGNPDVTCTEVVPSPVIPNAK